MLGSKISINGIVAAIVVWFVLFVIIGITLWIAFVAGGGTLLGLLLLGGGVAGAQFGAALGTRLRGEETRALLGLMVLGVAASLLWGLVRRPENLFSLGPAL